MDESQMNAQGLAKDLDVASSEMEYGHIVSDWKLLSMSANLLRHQDEQIKRLKQIIEKSIDMNNALARMK